MLFAVVGYLGGKRLAYRLAFPIGFVVLAFPIPGKLYNAAVFPLKLLVTRAACGALNLIGFDPECRGNLIRIGAGVIGVTDACSGLNSLMAALALSVFYGHLKLHRHTHRILLVVLTLPLVMIANILRVTAAAWITACGSAGSADPFFHTLEGITVFALVVLGMMATTKILSLAERK